MRVLVGAVIGLVVAVAGAAFVLGRGKEQAPLPATAQADSILIEKSRHRLTLYRDGQVLRSYAVALGSGGLDAKTREGDRKTPEGHYHIDSRNPHSAFHLALHVSYPETQDVAAAKARGQDPGGEIMIHGIRNGMGWLSGWHRVMDWTAGCVAVTDTEIEEIWRVVPNGTPVDIQR
ncbi:L,D-transpeptidase family protein [Nitrospirillum sp. BR 11828]|uniref:L,D-transpeptidase family protein n=1 Tax=Nitrospirillum sp. BR 11828 TaxID=3104325 RepID=UPI002ACAB07D|nr:L,D-transpeptidase family protein [Nitrospirillum sp. BR 11828]MDZ5650148.1 L,D-transpeptidase family protein [Nitrospirillum sp. BR 11828]